MSTSAAFISYSREDSEFALRLAQDLKAAGAAVWLDQLDIKPGHPWDNAIEDALIDANQMLVILSPSSARSPSVRDEISFALEAGKIIVPVLYMDCVVPLRLQRTQRIDFRSDYTRGLTSLLDQLRVVSPNQAVLDEAAEAETKRQAAWEAREAEAQRLKQLKDRQLLEEEQRKSNEIEQLHLEQAAERKTHEREAEAARLKEAGERQAASQAREAEMQRLSQEYEAREADIRDLKQREAGAKIKPWMIGLAIGGLCIVVFLVAIIGKSLSKVHEETTKQEVVAPMINTEPAKPSNPSALIPTPNSVSTQPATPPARIPITSPAQLPKQQPVTLPKPVVTQTGSEKLTEQQLSGSKYTQACLTGNQQACLKQESCDGGNADSCFTLGSLYFYGAGVPQDLEMARRFMQRACNLHNQSGCDWLKGN